MRQFEISGSIFAIAALAMVAPPAAFAAADAALTGVVSSAAEGAMEGVVVTAKRDGSIVSTSVATDKSGHYSFPADRLEPGHYSITIRAAGFELAGPVAADVATEATATKDLTLNKTKKLASQLTNAEWLASMPGTDAQKRFLLDCNGCHTYERIARSTHDAAEWAQVITRMKGYAPVSQPIKPQRFPDEARAGTPDQYKAAAEYLASINLSGADTWSYPLKTLPRPSGRATHVIVTEYQLPRETIEPHDVVVDKTGAVWYSDFGEMFISKFDPKTLKLTEYPVKELKPGFPEGNLDLEADKQGTLWFDTMFQGALGNIDPATGKMNLYPLPAEYNNKGVQLNFVGLRHDVDGRVWTKDVGSQHIYRLDLASGKWDMFDPTKLLDANGRHGVYQVESDSHNNLWMAEYTDGHLGKIDAKTGKVTWYDLPTPHARARRIEIDAQDHVIFTEYQGNKVAIFDPATEKFTEYPLPEAWYGPYRAQVDKNGEIWTSGMNTDRVVRIDPKTGKSVEYLMPSDTNMRTVFIDNSTTPVTFWTGSNHGAALVKVEPLD
ncbi:MAG TPA: carboxypeptidase regulatory-like domain-containing protein [Stellaceae bacterium]|nr:carboxypeptidase regulatory-like domain-containing protein [Stellaceae bacterium]